MSKIPHELFEDFPSQAGKIATLQLKDAHFARLVDAYEEINRAVHAAETMTQPTDEAHETELRRKRVQLKDEIGRMLTVA